eukprot:TRINITY_DN32184_c0_g1_i1.p1 TRINITY_DN32184_c0_g1~~TRINITY_DN32184_c0_g1_i1.p1  ORF type:complete len:180 (+),score=21.54 TRINITY_DN32184_c0_g1_i1:61-540(+)
MCIRDSFNKVYQHDICEYLLETKAALFNYTKCTSLGGGVLQNGLSEAVPYFYSTLRDLTTTLTFKRFEPTWVLGILDLDEVLYMLIQVYNDLENAHTEYAFAMTKSLVLLVAGLLSLAIFLLFLIIWKRMTLRLRDRIDLARRALVSIPPHLILSLIHI